MARFIQITVVYNNYKRRSLMAYTIGAPEKRNTVIESGVVEKLLTNIKCIVGNKGVKHVFVRHQILSRGVYTERVIQQYSTLDLINPRILADINRSLCSVTDTDCPVAPKVMYAM